MSNNKKYPNLDIPKKIVTCLGSGNIKARVLTASPITGLSDRMHVDIIIEKYWKVLVGDK